MLDVYSFIATYNPSAWSKCRQPSGAVLHSSPEPSELTQWLSHDVSTVNIVLVLLLLTYLLTYLRT